MNTQESNIIHLTKYSGREGKGEFRIVRDIDEVERLCNSNRYVWIVSNSGDARRVTINGAVRRWKRDRTRIEVPIKYGMYEYGTLDARDIAAGRVLRPIE